MHATWIEISNFSEARAKKHTLLYPTFFDLQSVGKLRVPSEDGCLESVSTSRDYIHGLVPNNSTWRKRFIRHRHAATNSKAL